MPSVARRTGLSRRLLAAEAGLGLVVAVAMIVILAATGVWWATLAERAPLFLSSDPSTPVNAQLAATAAVMVVSAGTATAGAIRIARTWARSPVRSGGTTIS